MGGGGETKQETRQVVSSFPGVFGFKPIIDPETGEQTGQEVDFGAGAQFATRAGQLAEQDPTAGAFQPRDVPRQASSSFAQPLQQALLSPEFGATTASEEALLGDIQSRTQGASALRGLGPATQGALAQNLAPALIRLRQQRVANLQGALGQDLASQLQFRGQDIGLRGQDIGLRQQDIGARQTSQQTAIRTLLELAGLSMPQLVAGQETSGRGFDFGVTARPAAGGG